MKEIFHGWEERHVLGTGDLAPHLIALNLSFCSKAVHADGVKRIMFSNEHRKLWVIVTKSVLGPGYNDYGNAFFTSDFTSIMKMILLTQN